MDVISFSGAKRRVGIPTAKQSIYIIGRNYTQSFLQILLLNAANLAKIRLGRERELKERGIEILQGLLVSLLIHVAGSAIVQEDVATLQFLGVAELNALFVTLFPLLNNKQYTFVYSATASSVFPCDTKSFPFFFRLFNSFDWRARLPKE